MFPSVPSGKCQAEGDDDMVLPTHLSCWLSPATAEWDDEATLCDAAFTGFTTPSESHFLRLSFTPQPKQWLIQTGKSP